MNKIVEFKVRPVTRYIITHYEGSSVSNLGSSSVVGEFDNFEHAVKTAQCLYDCYPIEDGDKKSIDY